MGYHFCTTVTRYRRGLNDQCVWVLNMSSSTPAKRMHLCSLFTLKKRAADGRRSQCEAYREYAPSRAKICNSGSWRFKSDDSDTSYEELAGRPAILKDAELENESWVTEEPVDV